MTFRPSERAGLIEPYRVPQTEIEDVVEVAHRDVKAARELVDIDLDWALIVAYNAALQAGLALMYAKGMGQGIADQACLHAREEMMG